METLWFVLVFLMLTIFVILDGFDFGTGIIYLFVAKTDIERRLVLKAIGPVWDGNEVWLIAGGGTLFFAFPTVYASLFSGFYLALILVLWLLILRGLSMELRSQINNSLWSSFWDSTLSFASVMIAIVLGAALGNLLRGVPVSEDGYFFVALWTNLDVGTLPGILDWYTVSVGVFALVMLIVHGANYIAFKTEGEVQNRSQKISKKFGWILLIFAIVIPFITPLVQNVTSVNFINNPVGLLLPLAYLISLGFVIYFRYKNKDKAAFVSSSTLILTLMLSAIYAIFPNILISTLNPDYSLTIYNSSASAYGLSVGLIWFLIGMSLATAYTIYMYRSFKNKVKLSDIGNDEGHY